MKPTVATSCAILGLVVALLAPPAAASFPDGELYIPAIGRGPGAAESQWYTTVWIYNPGDDVRDVTVSLLLRAESNAAPDQQQISVAAGATLLFPDVVAELFGLDSTAGALRLTSDGPIVAGARVYNQPGDTVRESQGQLMSALPGRLAIRAGESSDIPAVAQPSDGTFRSNFGLVETAGATADVLVTLYDADGVELATRRLSVGPYGALQRPLTSLGAAAEVTVGRLRIAVDGGDGAVLAYASAVANGTRSQDPTTLEMNFDAAAISSPAGVTSVVAGAGLSGGGTGDVALAVRPGDGIAASADGVAIQPGGIRADHVAAGELVLGAKVGNTVLHDVVTLAAGDGVALSTTGNTVTITAQPAAADRIEVPVTGSIAATSAGSWVAGSDRLQLPAAGRWRVGYRVVARVQNFGVGTTSDPVTIALFDLGHGQQLIRGTLSVVGLQVGIGVTNRAMLTVAGESVIEFDAATDLVLAGRTSNSTVALTVLPHDVDLSPGLAAPDATSILYAEALD